jgi:dynein heavy chain
MEPYVGLWTTIDDFYNSYSVWMNGPFWKLSPEQVEAEAADAYRCAYLQHVGGVNADDTIP